MSVSDFAVRWKFIKKQLELVQDPILRNIMLAEIRKRAIRDWGFDPEGKDLNKDIVLNDWEKDLVEDINDFKSFGVDNRVEKREKEKREAKSRMKSFIEKGGNLCDIPEEIRTDTIKKLYYDCLLEYGDEIMEDADRFIKK